MYLSISSSEDCEKECEEIGGKLATIHSADENDFISHFVLAGGGTPTTYFAGGSYGNWVDGAGPCAVMMWRGENRGKWMKTDCSTGMDKPWGCCTADCICKK